MNRIERLGRQQGFHLFVDKPGGSFGAQPIDEIYELGIGPDKNTVTILLDGIHDDLRGFVGRQWLDRGFSVRWSGNGDARVSGDVRADCENHSSLSYLGGMRPRVFVEL